MIKICFLFYKHNDSSISQTSIMPSSWLQGLTSLSTLEWGGSTGEQLDLFAPSRWNLAMFPISGMPALNSLNLSHASGFSSINNVLLSIQSSNVTSTIFPNLHVLDVTGCQLTGTLSSFVPLLSLKELHGAHNLWTGNLQHMTTSFGTELEIIDIRNNNLSEEMTIGMFQSFRHVRKLLLSNNQLQSKELPFDYLFSLKRLEVLDLAFNANLSGILPSAVPISLNLKRIDVRGGILTGLDATTLGTKYSTTLVLDQTNVNVDSSSSSFKSAAALGLLSISLYVATLSFNSSICSCASDAATCRAVCKDSNLEINIKFSFSLYYTLLLLHVFTSLWCLL